MRSKNIILVLMTSTIMGIPAAINQLNIKEETNQPAMSVTPLKTHKVDEQEISHQPVDQTVDEKNNLSEHRQVDQDEVQNQVVTDDEVIDVLSQYDVIYTVENPEMVTLLVDKTYKLPDTYEPSDLRVINVAYSNQLSGPSQTMLTERAATAVEKMFADAKSQGIILLARSGYRSFETQEKLYNDYVAVDGQVRADMYSARPGHSEHQTGLAIDITADSVNRQLIQAFGETKEGQWLKENAHHYGFILSYQEGKEELTGYQYEPWHYRYVGEEVATEIYENDWLLREYATVVGAIQ